MKVKLIPETPTERIMVKAMNKTTMTVRELLNLHKGSGRPIGAKNKPKKAKRGRPKGSKNKPKKTNKRR